jgi:hypothetical protein
VTSISGAYCRWKIPNPNRNCFFIKNNRNNTNKNNNNNDNVNQIKTRLSNRILNYKNNNINSNNNNNNNNVSFPRKIIVTNQISLMFILLARLTKVSCHLFLQKCRNYNYFFLPKNLNCWETWQVRKKTKGDLSLLASQIIVEVASIFNLLICLKDKNIYLSFELSIVFKCK